VTNIFIKTFFDVTWLIGEYASVSTNVSVLFYRDKQFTDDENRDISRNVSILAGQPRDAAAISRKFIESFRL
jgi:hypothetical protein